MEFKTLMNERRSSNNFDIQHVITEQELKDIITLTRLAPSAFNLQSTEYLAITDKESKEFISAHNFNQYKIKSASAMILVLGNPNKITINEAVNIYQPMLNLKMLDKDTFNFLVEGVKDYRDLLNSSKQTMTTELTIGAALSVGFLLLSAKEFGYDTCPMHINNTEIIKAKFNIPKNVEVVMMVALGKGKDNKIPRATRRTASDILKINKYI